MAFGDKETGLAEEALSGDSMHVMFAGNKYIIMYFEIACYDGQAKMRWSKVARTMLSMRRTMSRALR